MATYYAWSNFPVEHNDFGQPTKTIKAGEKISQSDLKVSDEDWENLIELGAVREEEYPKDLGTMESPAEYLAAHPEEAEEAPPAPPAQPAQQSQPASKPPA
jgi:hypothetical protein